MKTAFWLLTVFGMWLVVPGFQKSVDKERAVAELLEQHKRDRQAHFQTDPELLLSHHPEEGFVSVSSGKISRPTKAETQGMFAGYFKDAKYFEWDDLEPPVVRVSNDGTMAWMITRIKVRRVQKDESGVERERKFVYAGIMTYEKRGGKWIKTANVSTFE